MTFPTKQELNSKASCENGYTFIHSSVRIKVDAGDLNSKNEDENDELKLESSNLKKEGNLKKEAKSGMNTSNSKIEKGDAENEENCKSMEGKACDNDNDNDNDKEIENMEEEECDEKMKEGNDEEEEIEEIEEIEDEKDSNLSENNTIDLEYSDVKYQKLESILEKTKKYSEITASQIHDFFSRINTLNENKDKISPKPNQKRQKNQNSGRKNPKRRRQSNKTEDIAEEDESKENIKTENQKNRNQDQSSKEKEKYKETEVEIETNSSLINNDLLSEQKKILPDFHGVLKDYQINGVKWLISLWMTGSNGILADQMGLGKTIQALALISHLISQKIPGYFLVVAPLSTLQNWQRETNKWMPNQSVVVYHGTKEERNKIRLKLMPKNVSESSPIIITSYEIAINDRRCLKSYKWKYMVVDEGHRLKNYACKLFASLSKFKAETILLLTGTPLQNNLSELWSLLNFILPNIFSSLDEFLSWFKFAEIKKKNEDSSKKEMSKSILTKLHEILRPFVLRRLKKDVLHCLPKKKEIILITKMTPNQQKFYKIVQEKSFQYPNSNISFDIKKSQQCFRNRLVQLKKICNHPYLFSTESYNDNYPTTDQLIMDCGKFELFIRILKELEKRNHKVLVFSQMTRVLDIIEYYLNEKKIQNYRIDGSVDCISRNEQMDEFNSLSPFSVFLLSTRAGGLGINLTSADTVILYDSDWNPHADMQAMDRCHRIGQNKPVHVYRLMTSNSIEQRIFEVANEKLKLEHLVLEKGKFKHDYQSYDDDNIRNKDDDEWNDVIIQEILNVDAKNRNSENQWIMSGSISDENLTLLLDRTDMLNSGSGNSLPTKGPGWLVQERDERNLLSTID